MIRSDCKCQGLARSMIGCGSRDCRCFAEWRHCLSPLAGKCTTRLEEANSQHANSVSGSMNFFAVKKSRGGTRHSTIQEISKCRCCCRDCHASTAFVWVLVAVIEMRVSKDAALVSMPVSMLYVKDSRPVPGLSYRLRDLRYRRVMRLESS